MKKRSQLLQGLIDGTLSAEDKTIALEHKIVMLQYDNYKEAQKETAKPKIIKRRKLNG